MLGLGPSTHDFAREEKDVDPRDKPEDDDIVCSDTVSALF
jgi:hypothetical protein